MSGEDFAELVSAGQRYQRVPSPDSIIGWNSVNATPLVISPGFTGASYPPCGGDETPPEKLGRFPFLDYHPNVTVKLTKGAKTMGNQERSSQKSDFSAYLAIAIPFLILGSTTANPAFFVVGLYFLIIGISEGEDEQDQES